MMHNGPEEKTFTAAVDLRGQVGKAVSRTNEGKVWLAGKNKPILGIIKRGAKKGGVVTVQVAGPAKLPTMPPVFETAAKMTPGPYTTCRKCRALVAVSDVRDTMGYCGNCAPAIIRTANDDTLGTYRTRVGDLAESVIHPGGPPNRMSDALRALIVFYVQDQLTEKADEDYPELPERDD